MGDLKVKKAGYVFLAALGLVGFGVYAHQQRPQCLAAVPLVEASSVLSGTSPEFSLKDVDGREVTLSQFKGKVVLVNYWATWCGLCRVEMPGADGVSRQVRRSLE